MELLDPFSAWSAFFVVWGVVVGIAFIVGALMDDNDGTIGALTGIGVFFGFIIALLTVGSAYDEYKDDALETFENTYQVSVVEGKIPTGPNDRNSTLMYTKDGGPLACIVSTDDVEYTVVCDGEDLRPVNN